MKDIIIGIALGMGLVLAGVALSVAAAHLMPDVPRFQLLDGGWR